MELSNTPGDGAAFWDRTLGTALNWLYFEPPEVANWSRYLP